MTNLTIDEKMEILAAKISDLCDEAKELYQEQYNAEDYNTENLAWIEKKIRGLSNLC